MKRTQITGMVMMALVAVAARGEVGAMKPELGVGLVVSPGYRDTLEQAYPDSEVSGGYGWLELYFGMRYEAAPQFEVIPKIGLLANFVSSVGGDDSFANTIVQPAVGGRYLFSEGDSFFVEGELSYNAVNTGSDSFDVDGGIGYAALVGYRWEAGFSVAVGYSMISTDVTYEDWGADSATGDENFGGVEFRFSGSF